jgi:uncharacterized protein YcnI
MLSLRRSVTVLTAACALAAMSVVPALAHVTANPNTATADGFGAFSLRVPHGCGDSGTVELAVQIPAGIQSVTPEQVPGWTVSTEIGELDEPYESHGEMVTEGVTAVIWSADEGEVLPTDQFREFGMSVRIGDVEEGRMYLPTVQTCEDGEHAWVEIPAEGEAWGDLDEPAPYVDILASEGGGHSHGSDDEDADEVATSDAHDGDEAPDASTDAPTDEEFALVADTTTAPALVSWLALGIGVLGLAVGSAGFAASRRTS